MRYKLSCGIICFDGDSVLLCKRRDTYEYQIIVYGRYQQHNLPTLVSYLSKSEQKRLVSYSFEDIWDDIWVNKTHDNYVKDFNYAKSRFEANFELLKSLLASIPSRYHKKYKWSFPKGKPNDKEKFINCALREFQEETRIGRRHIHSVMENPLDIIYKGTDDKWYRSIFWIYHLSHKLGRGVYPLRINSKIRPQTHSEEIQKLKWVKISEIGNYLPPNVYAACVVHFKTMYPDIDFGVKVISQL